VETQSAAWPLEPFWPDDLEPEDGLAIHNADPTDYLTGLLPPASGETRPTFMVLPSDDARDVLVRAIELKSMPYEQYLQSPEWKARSAAARKRSGFTCAFCDSATRLEVHHRTDTRLGANRRPRAPLP